MFQLKSRSAILFSRLLPDIARGLNAESTSERVMELLVQSCTSTSASVDERNALIRILASFSQPSSAFLSAARQRKLAAVLMRQLPEPRKEAGEWTATSVCLPPQDKIYPQVIGNICKIFIVLVEDDVCAKSITSTEGIAKLICCLSNQSNVSVRQVQI